MHALTVLDRLMPVVILGLLTVLVLAVVLVLVMLYVSKCV
jgi:hypothetical protein